LHGFVVGGHLFGLILFTLSLLGQLKPAGIEYFLRLEQLGKAAGKEHT
jgi:hypothetical protein